MKIKNIMLTISAVVITSCLLMACGSSGQAGESGQKADEAKGPQTAVFALETNPTTGFDWNVQQSKEIFDVTIDYTQNETEDEAVGVGGTDTITLKPKTSGECTVTLSYERGWEGGEVGDVFEYNFTVDENDQITCEPTNADAPMPTIE